MKSIKKPSLPVLIALLATACGSEEYEPVRADASASEHYTSLARVTRAQPAAQGLVGGQASKSRRLARAVTGDLSRHVTTRVAGRNSELWLSNDMVVEFGPSEAGRAAIAALDPEAVEVPQAQSGVRLWRVTAGQGIDSFAADLCTEELCFAPAMHRTSDSSSDMRAAAGGVLVTFPKDWQRSTIDVWCASLNMVIERVLIEESNLVLIASAPGLAAVELANTLHEGGELVEVTPNWWSTVSVR